MNYLTKTIVGIVSLCLCVTFLGGAAAVVAQATPETESMESPIVNVAGDVVGSLQIAESADGVSFSVILNAGALPPGEHGIHIHEVGTCDPAGESPFESAGGHLNPTAQTHGAPGDEMSHAGDLGNLTVADDGSASFTITTDRVTLASGKANSLVDGDGTALVIHAEADDLSTDPSGNSGDRELCSVISGPATTAT